MHTGADFISLRGEESRTSKPRRGLTSSRGHYGPPKGPVTSASPRQPSSLQQSQDPVRTKRKREATLDRVRNEHLIRMPWHGSDPYLDGIVGLHEEIEDFYHYMVPSVQEHTARLQVVDRIRKSVLAIYPAARVEIFGSFRTGLYLPTSDIDLVICGKWPTLPFGDLSEALQHVAKPGSLKVLERAAVPIIKLADDVTGIKVDISFNMANGLRAAELIKHFKKRYPALPKLIYVLKQFLYQRDLNEVYSGGLSSYALILMVVSFLQQHVREDARESKANLGVLLVEFFELYGVLFNYTRTAIRIIDDGAYLLKENASCYQGAGFGALCIEDPFDANNDVGKSSYGFPTVKKIFEQAYFHLLKSVTPASGSSSNQPQDNLSILSQILRVNDDVLDFRQSIATLFEQSCDQDNNVSSDVVTPEDPLHPSIAIRTSARDVSPKELRRSPAAFFFANPSPDDLLVRNISAENKPKNDQVTCNGTKSNNELPTVAQCDNLSAISMGVSSSSSESEGDGLINGQASPNSAMSISPATSEVCSILDPNEKNHQNSNRQSTTSLNNASNLKQRNNKSSRGSSRQLSSPQQNVDRSDLDLDWRSNTTSTTNATNTTTTQRQLSADEDTNWRDHKPLNEDRGDNSWRTIKSKNRKIQGNSTFEEKKHQHVSSKNDNQVGKSVVLDNDKSVSLASSVATTTATTVSNNQVDSCISILDNDKEVVKSKKKYKKKNKKQKNANSTMTTSELSASSTSSKDTSVESDHHNNISDVHSSKCSQAQVSRLPGQIKPKR